LKKVVLGQCNDEPTRQRLKPARIRRATIIMAQAVKEEDLGGSGAARKQTAASQIGDTATTRARMPSLPTLRSVLAGSWREFRWRVQGVRAADHRQGEEIHRKRPVRSDPAMSNTAEVSELTSGTPHCQFRNDRFPEHSWQNQWLGRTIRPGGEKESVPPNRGPLHRDPTNASNARSLHRETTQ